MPRGQFGVYISRLRDRIVGCYGAQPRGEPRKHGLTCKFYPATSQLALEKKKPRAPSPQGETKGTPPDVTICSSGNIHNANFPTQYGNHNQLVIGKLSTKSTHDRSNCFHNVVYCSKTRNTFVILFSMSLVPDEHTVQDTRQLF